MRTCRMTSLGLQLLVMAACMQVALSAAGSTSSPPSIREAVTHPVHVYEGDDALITCVVSDVGDSTVMWKKEDRERHSRRVLIAGEVRVTADKRFDVLHDDGGDVWVLVIHDALPSDSGVYVCEVNTTPPLQSMHKLSVLSRSLLPPSVNSTASFIPTSRPTTVPVSASNHNYTDCCVASNVTSSCFGFCNIQSILEGSTGQDPEQCEADFPAIVRCMADGRNHAPCCIQEGVPDICQDVCRGEYTTITDNIKTHFSCSAYTEQTLACIVEGVELLPSPPEGVEVEALTETSLNVSWRPPTGNFDTITEYIVNVTSLRSFDPDDEDPAQPEDSYAAAAKQARSEKMATSTQAPSEQQVVMQIKAPRGSLHALAVDLRAFTMYEVTVTSRNTHGSSLPSYAIRTLTLTPGKVKATKVADAPTLPDVRGCCLNSNITHTSCVDKLCDPLLSDVAGVTDLMICAPWAKATFACLSNNVDHTPCCRARGLPAICQDLCSGNVTQIDFSYFKCLKYMSDYSSCLLQGYGVLPSSPLGIRVSNVDVDFAIVHWEAPKTLGDTVQSYNLHYRALAALANDYRGVPKVSPPFVLEHLDSDSDYEVFVEAVNAHGVGEPSARVIFKTASKLQVDQIEEANAYNVTACCVSARLSEVCLPLCSYDASMTDIKALASICAPELSKLLRCGAGGRNHDKCCVRRGVASNCLPLCLGVIGDSLLVTASTCIPFIGNIVQCFEEGKGLLPGPIGALHATRVTNSSISLEWDPPIDGNITDFMVYYQKMDNMSMHETLYKLAQEMNVTSTTATLDGLEGGHVYRVFVVSRNRHGTSLPSSQLVINVTHTDVGAGLAGVSTPPHSLVVSSHSATWVTVSWQPPEFSDPAEPLQYRLSFKPTASETFDKIETSVTSHLVDKLTPNTQYIVFVTAISKQGDSPPSETLIAWTDPAYPAFVETPTVHPINMVVEGSSMSVLCIAMGTPMPVISLYISGRLVRQETTRHMVTVMHNVTRDMDQISCYADNGYGMPMQASRKITISHVPTIQASGITMASPGALVVLECSVEAHPEPKMLFWRDHNGRVPVIQGGKYSIVVKPVKDAVSKYTMKLTIERIAEADEGDYFCHAENAFGSATQPVSVRIRNVAASNNVTQCCVEQNVTSACMDACSFYLDIDAVIDKPECIGDFDKLMRCAADGSDHRSCCAQWGVPRRCLDWCRGEPLFNNKFCVLSYTKQIMACFQEGRDRLPGPPQNVRLETMDTNSVVIKWDPPIKNPATVEMYRVFWRQAGARSASKNDTKMSSMRISGLKEGATYECVLKAGNHLGTSTLTEPLRFTMGDKYVTSASSLDGDSSHVGVAVGVVLALFITAALVVAAVWFVRVRRLLGNKSPGVAFENPSYLREVNMDHIQIPQGNGNAASTGESVLAGGPGVNPASSPQPTAGWRQETLHASSTEVAPTLYEELKLGHEGAGFKRLK